MFQTPGQQQQAGLADDRLESRKVIQRHPIMKWQQVGSFVEFAMVDYNDQAPVKENGVQKVQQFTDGTSKLKTQDVLTGLVLGGTGLYSPPEDDNRLEVVAPGMLVTQFIAGHNRWDPNRPQHHGESWRDAKDLIGRDLSIGDLVRIDYVAFEEVASNGRKLQNGKKVLAFQVRALGGTPEEIAILERCRAARAAIKNPQPAAPSQPGFRPVPVASAPAPAAAAPVATPPAQAQPVRSLFE